MQKRINTEQITYLTVKKLKLDNKTVNLTVAIGATEEQQQGFLQVGILLPQLSVLYSSEIASGRQVSIETSGIGLKEDGSHTLNKTVENTNTDSKQAPPTIPGSWWCLV